MVPGAATLVALGRAVIAGGALTSQTSRGGALYARTGAGTGTLTLSDGGVDATECVITTQCEGAAMATVSIVHTSDTVKTFAIFDNAGMALDNTSFSYMVFRLNS